MKYDWLDIAAINLLAVIAFVWVFKIIKSENKRTFKRR